MILHVKDTLRLLYPVRVLLFGLVIAQLIGTVLVYVSNHTLARKLTAVQAAGYGPLPGMNLDPALVSWSAALSGGVFFSLSIGAGIVVICLVAVMLVGVLTEKGWTPGIIIGWAVRIILGALWLSIFLWGNNKGVNYGLSAFLILLPPSVIVAALAWSPGRSGGYGERRQLPWRRTFHCFLIVALTLLWASRVDSEIFVNIKDNLLLTTRPGIKAVQLYYRYNLYAAETVKSLQQKQVKTCVLENFIHEVERQRMKDRLLDSDYFTLPATTAAPVDLVCRKDGARLLFFRQGREVMTVSVREWWQPSGIADGAGDILEQFGTRTDTARTFRQATFYLLLGATPLTIYLVVFAVFAVFPGLFFDMRLSSWLVPVLGCLFLGVVVFYMDAPSPDKMDRAQIAQSVASGTRREKIAALRFIYRQGLDIQNFDGYQQVAEDGDFAEQYWLLKNYGHSHQPEVLNHIIAALDSRSAYVVCKAMESLRQQVGTIEPSAVKRLLLRELTASDNWYIQLYAYKFLRDLGWKPLKAT